MKKVNFDGCETIHYKCCDRTKQYLGRSNDFYYWLIFSDNKWSWISIFNNGNSTCSYITFEDALFHGDTFDELLQFNSSIEMYTWLQPIMNKPPAWRKWE